LIAWIFFSFFGPVKFASVQLSSSPSFPLLDATSPPTDIVTPVHHVTLPFH
jgi:hypothetical protein